MALIFCKLCLCQKEELWKRDQSIVRLSFHIFWRSRQLLKKRTNEFLKLSLLQRCLQKAGPRPTACDGPAARWTSSDFPQFFCPAVNSCASTDLHRVWAFGRAKWTKVSLNSFTILIIISILFDPFFPCMLLSEKRCHSLFIRLFTEPDREEVHSQTM